MRITSCSQFMNGSIKSRVSEISSRLSLNAARNSTTANNRNYVHHDISEPPRTTASQNEATPPEETTGVSADDVTNQKTGKYAAIDSGRRGMSFGSLQSRSPAATSSKLNGFHSTSDGLYTSKRDEFRLQFAVQTPLHRPRFSTYGMTSSHAPPPMTSRVTGLPVKVGQSALSGPSVDRTWETLRTDSSRPAVVQHKTTSPPSVCTSGRAASFDYFRNRLVDQIIDY